MIESGQMSSPRTVVVTGCAAGIGEGVVRRFAGAGDNVVMIDIDKDGLARLEAELTGAGTVVSVPGDVTDAALLDDAVALAVERFGRVDVLVGAAGGHSGAQAAEEVTDETWQKSLDLNLTSAFKSARAVIPVMKQQGSGRIIMVSSATGRMPTTVASSVIHYAVAKAGIMGLVRQLAVELGPHGVTVNAVAPGTTYTPRVERIRTRESLSGIAATIPLGRVAEVEDQVGPIYFLAGADASYLTGVVLDVNGGRVMS
jgi:NAD(P)-dependent dehydrogenase (short-subunit alcohol dehydrogenase family)